MLRRTLVVLTALAAVHCGSPTSDGGAGGGGDGGGAPGVGGGSGGATSGTGGGVGGGSTGGGVGGGQGGTGGTGGVRAPDSTWRWQHPLPQGNHLLAAWANSPTDAWAVGEQGTIIHWNGTTWSGASSGTIETL